MRILARLTRGLGVLAITAGALFLFQGAPRAWAATGNVLADIAPPASTGGVSAAFDGHDLYYTSLGGAVLHRSSPSGFADTDIPLLGGVGINAITYDASHDVFWGVDATGLNVYRIERDGWVGLEFTIIPTLDLPGQCNSFTGCSPTVSGLAYDATNDSLWYLPQGSSRVYHFNTAGQSLGYFDTANLPDCASNGVTGIAAGASVLYLTAGSCSRGFQYAKSDTGAGTKLSSFSVGGIQSAGASCDNTSFPSKTALWVRDASTGHLRAIEIAAGTCMLGGGVAPPDPTTRWMSGSGLGFGNAAVDLNGGVQFAFHLLCDQGGGPPNNMVVNWQDVLGNRFSFHLEQWTPSDPPLNCFYDSSTPSSPPPCDPIADPTTCFNTMQGTGLGRLIGRGPNGQPLPIGGTCNPRIGDTLHCGILDQFQVTDRGEPNTMDTGTFGISDPIQGGILAVCACVRSNFQAHSH
jgi:hypothetical protein